jgi:hypothetical protein
MDPQLPNVDGGPSGCFVYGGDRSSLELAAKGAGNELRGAGAYFAAGSDVPVRVPLQALVDFNGFRVVVMPLLPLVPGRPPVYGSADGLFVVLFLASSIVAPFRFAHK